jgi:formate C-acetyltransferase
VKSQDGAAMSIGRLSGFFDVYAERDLAAGPHHRVRTPRRSSTRWSPSCASSGSCAPSTTTRSSPATPTGPPGRTAGFANDGRTLVTKTSFRLLQTLRNLGPAPEPNITIYWDPKLPAGYKEFCAQISIETSAIQYESDAEIRAHWGDDTAIACCVSPMAIGKQMQFFGARLNSAKALLYAINGGRDEMSGKLIVPGYEA